ncbi:esterase/lipase family protein [Sphingomonas sp. RS6]
MKWTWPVPLSRHQPPPRLAMLAETPRAVYGLAELAGQWRALGQAPRGDGRPVMILPGLFNSDRANLVLRWHLHRLGYDARGWGMGRNLGARTIGADGERLMAAIEARVRDAGEPVTLIGISLGGIMARIAARRHPEWVRAVVTISSPYAGHPRATNVWRPFEWLSGERVSDAAVIDRLSEAAAALPVPATAIWSRSDGLVNGLNCRTPNARAVEVRSSHLWVQMRAAVLSTVAEALARDDHGGGTSGDRGSNGSR